MPHSKAQADARPGPFVAFTLGTVLATAVALLAIDNWAYHRQGILDHFGRGTQEGQVLHKLRLAEKLASEADVILFGSSMTRSGIASEPFLDAGLLPINLAVSGGGPLFASKMLDRLAPIIERRTEKPTLVLEVYAPSLLRKQHWDEYPQFISLERNRLAAIGDFASLYSHFREQGVSSNFVQTLVLPSLYYSTFLPAVLSGRRFNGSFYGVEDSSGFAPIGTSDPSQFVPVYSINNPAPETVNQGTLRYLDLFLKQAKRLGTRVVLNLSPVGIANEADIALILDHLRELNDGLDLLIFTRDAAGLGQADYEWGGGEHPNSAGATKIAQALVDAIGGHDNEIMPPDCRPLPDDWSGPVIKDGAERIIAVGPGGVMGSGKDYFEIATPPIPVDPTSKYFIDVHAEVEQGKVWIQAIPVEGDSALYVDNSLSAAAPSLKAAETPVMIRAGSTKLSVRVIWYDPETRARVTFRRICRR